MSGGDSAVKKSYMDAHTKRIWTTTKGRRNNPFGCCSEKHLAQRAAHFTTGQYSTLPLNFYDYYISFSCWRVCCLGRLLACSARPKQFFFWLGNSLVNSCKTMISGGAWGFFAVIRRPYRLAGSFFTNYSSSGNIHLIQHPNT